jgi:hypothetical protein
MAKPIPKYKHRVLRQPKLKRFSVAHTFIYPQTPLGTFDTPVPIRSPMASNLSYVGPG